MIIQTKRLRAVLDRQKEVADATPIPPGGRTGLHDIASPSMVAFGAELGLAEAEVQALARTMLDHIGRDGNTRRVLSDREGTCLLVGLTFGYLARVGEERAAGRGLRGDS